MTEDQARRIAIAECRCVSGWCDGDVWWIPGTTFFSDDHFNAMKAAYELGRKEATQQTRL